MGRHKKMSAAAPPAQASEHLVALPAASSRRRLTVDDLTEEQRARYDTLRTLSIRVPESSLRTAAIEAAALVCSRIDLPGDSSITYARIFRIVARYLYTEACSFLQVDEERALTRSKVNRHLDILAETTTAVKTSTLRTHRWALFTAGRVLYPREYPTPRAPLAPRTARVPAADIDDADDLYRLVPALPEQLRCRLVLAPDLVTGAGAHTSELCELVGADVTALDGSARAASAVVIHFRDRGVIHRVVPIVHPGQTARLLTRAREVGPNGWVMPTNRKGVVAPDILGRISAELIRLGNRSADFRALRSLWLVQMSQVLPAAALFALTGASDLRVLTDRADQLPSYSETDVAEMLTSAGPRPDFGFGGAA